jgi:hypothetical protein
MSCARAATACEAGAQCESGHRVDRWLVWGGYDYFSLGSSTSVGDARSLSGSGVEAGAQFGMPLADTLTLVFLAKVGLLFPEGGKMIPLTGGVGLRWQTQFPIALFGGLGYCYTKTVSNNGVNVDNPNPKGLELFGGPSVAIGSWPARFQLLVEYGRLWGSVKQPATSLSFTLFRVNAGIGVAWQ